MQQLNQIEIGILDWIRDNLSCRFLDVTMRAITWLGNHGVFFVCLAVILLCIPRTRKLGTTFSIALVFEILSINVILKPLVGRMRPFVFNEGVELIVPALKSASFPSGHTGFAFAFALSLLVYGKKGVIPGVIFAIIMGFSRLYLYVHYPTDVICGAVIGSLCGLLAYQITKNMFNSNNEYMTIK
ncbi:MAG: phosphatase PAP2 family protein [Sphingobacteriia bacterium]|nr:phosphatase PAP2 family protein [Sphingobacteriia bacterium]